MRQALQKSSMRRALSCFTLLWLLMGTHHITFAAENAIVEVPFIDVRTGPGRGFPVFHILEEGEQFVIHKRRTAWLKISTTGKREVSGWVHVDAISTIRSTDNLSLIVAGFDRNNPMGRRFGWSIAGGDFNGASAIATALSFRMTNNLSISAEVGQVFAQASNATRYGVSIRHEPFPAWRLSPYFQLGTGKIDTQPFATLIAAEDRSDQMTSVGGGLSFYLTRQFTMYLDFKQYQVLTSRDTNLEINEWKLGFSVAF